MPPTMRLFIGLTGLFTSWGLALVLMLDDIDFFAWSDLFDTQEPHHEHIVVTILIMGVVTAIVSTLWGRGQGTRT